MTNYYVYHQEICFFSVVTFSDRASILTHVLIFCCQIFYMLYLKVVKILTLSKLYFKNNYEFVKINKTFFQQFKL